MVNVTDRTHHKSSKLDKFSLDFEYNQTIAQARKSTKLRALDN